MPPLSTGTKSCIRSPVDSDVSTFGGISRTAGDHVIVDDNSAPNSGPQGQQGKASGFASRTEPKFAVRRRVGVVCEKNRSSRQPGHFIAQGEMSPARHIDRLQDPPVLQIEGAWRSDTDSHNAILRFFQPGSGYSKEPFEKQIRRLFGRRLDGAFGQTSAIATNPAKFGGRAADINSQK